MGDGARRLRAPDAHPAELVPVLAHGARMSWAGLMRTGDEFPPGPRSRRATVTTSDGAPLQRFYGGWSDRYRRFTSNLSSPRLRVRVEDPDAAPAAGIQAVVHWVPRAALTGTGPGSVAAADGWPRALWAAFEAQAGGERGRPLGEQLQAFLHATSSEEVPVVRAWRRLLRAGSAAGADAVAEIGGAWVPVPAPLEGGEVPELGVVSWSPSPWRFASLGDALGSDAARDRPVDLALQARYYLECRLAALHGVRFSADDRLIDRAFEAGPAVRALRGEMTALERRRIGDARFGRLDRRGAVPTGPSDG